MTEDRSETWSGMLYELPVNEQRELNRILTLMAMFDDGERKPLPWRRRKWNLLKSRWRRNVSWRFARRMPGDDW